MIDRSLQAQRSWYQVVWAMLAVWSTVAAGLSLRYIGLAGAHVTDYIGGLCIIAIMIALTIALARSQRPLAAITAVAVLGIAERILSHYLFLTVIQDGDPGTYIGMANRLILEHQLGVRDPNFGGDIRATYPPLYPILLAGVRWAVGSNGLSITLLNSSIDIVSTILTYFLANRWFRPRVALTAASIFWMLPVIALAAPTAQKEGLTIALSLGIANAIVRSASSRWLKWSVIAGLCIGLLALTQPALATLGPIEMMVMLIITRSSWRRWTIFISVSALACVATLAPWAIRNWELFNRFVPLTAAGGTTFWSMAFHSYTVPDRLRGLIEPDRFNEMGREGLAFFRSHPVVFLKEVGEAAARGLFSSDDPAQRFLVFRKAVSNAPAAVMLILCQLGYASLLAGAAVCAKQAAWREPQLKALLAAAAIQIIGINVWQQFSERHRLFILPLLAIMASVAVVRNAGLNSESAGQTD